MTKPEVPAVFWPSQYPPGLGLPLPFPNLLPKSQFTAASFQLGKRRCFQTLQHSWSSSAFLSIITTLPSLPLPLWKTELEVYNFWPIIFQIWINESNKAKTDSVGQSDTERHYPSPWEEPGCEADFSPRHCRGKWGESWGLLGLGQFRVLRTPSGSDVANWWTMVLRVF